MNDAFLDRIAFGGQEVRFAKLLEVNLKRHNRQMSVKRPQELRQRAILNHAYSNPQCNLSNGTFVL